MSGDEAGACGEEEDGLSNLVGGSIAFHGSAGGKAPGVASGIFAWLIPIKLNPAGCNAVDADLGRECFGHGLCEHVQGSLGGAVVGVGCPGVDSAKGADVDDAATGGAQMRDGFAGNQKRASGVGFEGGVPLREADLFKGRGIKDGGVVDEDVEFAELC